MSSTLPVDQIIGLQCLIGDLENTRLVLEKVLLCNEKATQTLLHYPDGTLRTILETLWDIERYETLDRKINRAIERKKLLIDRKSPKSLKRSQEERQLGLERRKDLAELTCQWMNVHSLHHLYYESDLGFGEEVLRLHFSLSPSDYHRTSDRPYLPRLFTTPKAASLYLNLARSLIRTWSDLSGRKTTYSRTFDVRSESQRPKTVEEQIDQLATTLNLLPLNQDRRTTLQECTKSLIQLTSDWFAGTPCQMMRAFSPICDYLRELLNPKNYCTETIAPALEPPEAQVHDNSPQDLSLEPDALGHDEEISLERDSYPDEIVKDPDPRTKSPQVSKNSPIPADQPSDMIAETSILSEITLADSVQRSSSPIPRTEKRSRKRSREKVKDDQSRPSKRKKSKKRDNMIAEKILKEFREDPRLSVVFLQAQELAEKKEKEKKRKRGSEDVDERFTEEDGIIVTDRESMVGRSDGEVFYESLRRRGGIENDHREKDQDKLDLEILEKLRANRARVENDDDSFLSKVIIPTDRNRISEPKPK